MKRIILIFIISIAFIFNAFTASAQSTAQLNVTFSPERASATVGFKEIDILVSAGSGYTTGNAVYVPNKTNPNGSWTSINLRFTQSSTGTPFTNTELAVTYPVAGISGSSTAQNIAAGGCYQGKTAFSINILRASPAADAGTTPMVIATIRYPNRSGQKTFTIRNMTTQACAIRESFWSNTHTSNSSTRLPIVGNQVSFYSKPAPSATPAVVGLDKQMHLALYPNPVTGGEVTLQVASDLNYEDVQIVVSDAAGRVVSRQPAALNGGINQLTVTIEDLSAGFYFIQLKGMNSTLIPLRLIKK
jgi:hypothetical protein